MPGALVSVLNFTSISDQVGAHVALQPIVPLCKGQCWTFAGYTFFGKLTISPQENLKVGKHLEIPLWFPTHSDKAALTLYAHAPTHFTSPP